MFADEPTSPSDAPGVIEALSRYRVIAAGFTLTGLILGVLFTVAVPASTEAVGRLALADPRGVTIFHTGAAVQVDAARYLSDQTSILSSTEVLEAALNVRQAGGTTDELRQRCTFEPDETANVIAIRCSESSIDESIVTVDSIASAYRARAKQQTDQKAQLALAGLQQELDGVKKFIEDQRAANAPADVYATALATSAGDRLTAIQERMTEIRTTASLFDDGVSSFDAGRQPIPPSFVLTLGRNVFVGTAAGFLLALMIAWFMADRSPVAASSHEFAEALGMPLLGEIPSLMPGQMLDLVAAPEPAFQLVASNLSSIRADGLLVFLTPTPMYGHEEVVIKAALVAARAGKRVLLIDLDESTSGVSRTMGLGDGPGFGEFAVGRSSHDAVIARVGFSAANGVDDSVLYLMGAGSSTGDLVGLLRSRRAEEALRVLRGMFDVVIIDGPPLLSSAGAVSIGNAADGVIMIVQRGTPKVTLESVRRQLSFINADPVGFVLVEAD